MTSARRHPGQHRPSHHRVGPADPPPTPGARLCPPPQALSPGPGCKSGYVETPPRIQLEAGCFWHCTVVH